MQAAEAGQCNVSHFEGMLSASDESRFRLLKLTGLTGVPYLSLGAPALYRSGA